MPLSTGVDRERVGGYSAHMENEPTQADIQRWTRILEGILADLTSLCERLDKSAKRSAAWKTKIIEMDPTMKTFFEKYPIARP